MDATNKLRKSAKNLARPGRRSETPEIVRSRDVDLPYPPGAVLACDHGWFTHYGIAGDSSVEGEQTVISCSRRRRGTYEERLSVFADGVPVAVRGLIGNLGAHDIVARARADVGRAWSLVANNCEHHVTRACGLKPKSPQVRRVAGAAAVTAVVLIAPLRIAVLKGLLNVA